MKHNTLNVFVIAQKEIEDNLQSSRFKVLLFIFTLIVFSFSVREGMSGSNIFEQGFLDVAQIMGIFLPIVGIAIGFDAVVKERKSSSLTIFLTHPVFKDNIITGKMVAGLVTLAMVIVISVIFSVGTVLILTGVPVGLMELNRIFLFGIITFVYLSVFLAMGILLSIFSSNQTNSFIYGIVIWIILILMFGTISSATASIATGESIIDMENNQEAAKLNSDMQKLTPIHHYAEAVTGFSGISVGSVNFNSDQKASSGVFDLSHTLGKWFNDYWMNIVTLLVMQFLLFAASFAMFMHKDVNR
ncbi:conserved hypothetical protein [Methanohalobium evestigatum Z-7303]|uniref:ABC-2 type transporter n=1 Tax=Methanohalobium evestigatum (strain ATCC BAA-1072 / DSM 3721 / NBRC 107634 / OCM 161 / Z-7303) TaxID=644295 RepID=D7E9S4_METEZ|nr:ABC transporter permease [Methanohalobium evestigatum]ADI74346.1 conserved hypothetical protein [Methanohalobium evestigatum Z-7303]